MIPTNLAFQYRQKRKSLHQCSTRPEARQDEYKPQQPQAAYPACSADMYLRQFHKYNCVVVLHDTSCHCIYSDTVLCLLPRESACEHLYRTFGPSILKQSGIAHVSRHTAAVDTRVPALHVLMGVLGHVEHGKERWSGESFS